jgi:hypothetical protein
MAIINGFLAEQADSGYDRIHLSADLDLFGADWINDIRYWAAIPNPGVVAVTGNYPVSAAPRAISGGIARSYVDDFYHRVHINPVELDIGNLLSVQTRDVSIWNAHFTSKALSSIAESDTDGLEESGVVAPTTFGALEERTLSVTVTTNGPATIDALYILAFPEESPTLQVTGRRVVVFGHPPDWTKGIVEGYEWATDVIESYGGIEQRIGLRAAPRRKLSYAFTTFSENERASLAAALYGWQARVFAVPVWTDAQALTTGLAAGSTSVACVTDGYEFAATGLVVLWAGYNNHEALEVASVGAGTLTFASPTIKDWPAGTQLLPVRLGRLPERIKSQREAAFYMTQQAAFTFNDHPGWPVADPGDTYLGYRVHDLNARFVNDITIDYIRAVAMLDYKTAHQWVKDKSGFQTEIAKWNWILRNRPEIVAFRSWLAARDGRRVPFWTETLGNDMRIVATIGASDSSIQIENIGYQRYINGRADRRHIAIRTFSGAAYYRQITGATEIDSTVESLAIDTALGVNVEPAEIESVRFLRLSRLESDNIEIDWHNLGLAESTAALRSIPA